MDWPVAAATRGGGGGDSLPWAGGGGCGGGGPGSRGWCVRGALPRPPATDLVAFTALSWREGESGTARVWSPARRESGVRHGASLESGTAGGRTVGPDGGLDGAGRRPRARPRALTVTRGPSRRRRCEGPLRVGPLRVGPHRVGAGDPERRPPAACRHADGPGQGPGARVRGAATPWSGRHGPHRRRPALLIDNDSLSKRQLLLRVPRFF